MSKLSVQDVTKKDFFPPRPAFGTKGNHIVVWANSFEISIKGNQKFAKYAIEVTDADPQPAAKGKKGGAPAENDYKVKGKKLGVVIQLALQTLDKSVPFATEFKSQVVSLSPLTLPEDMIIQVEYTEVSHFPYSSLWKSFLELLCNCSWCLLTHFPLSLVATEYDATMSSSMGQHQLLSMI